MSIKTRDGKMHQTSVLITDSGLPIEGIATISGSYVFLEGNEALLYGGGLVTLPIGSDLTPVTEARPRYTGKYVLITKDNKIYYINRQSIDIPARTFIISTSDKVQANPILIDLSAGWVVADIPDIHVIATGSNIGAAAANVDYLYVEFLDTTGNTTRISIIQGVAPIT